ncbi:Serine/threonine-protein kinase [Venturia inaequalis]|nr:Serine/threonine-protein kinase [Venturia inaequalis]
MRFNCTEYLHRPPFWKDMEERKRNSLGKGVGLEASDEHGAMGNANALEVNEDKDEKTGHEVVQQNGLFKGLKPNHPKCLPISLLKTPPQNDIPPDVQEIINDFKTRKPSGENDILAAYREYRRVLMGTEVAFIAATWPRIIDHINMDPLHPGKTRRVVDTYTAVSSFNSNTITTTMALSKHQKTIIMNWCQSLGQPILEWQAQVAELRTVEINQIKIINRFSENAIQRALAAKTQESVSRSYLTYRKQLLATNYGGLFDDLPSHLPAQTALTDFKRNYNLRILSRHKLRRIEQVLDTTDEVDYSALIKERLELSVRISGLTGLLTHIKISWSINVDHRVRRAYLRLKPNLIGRWPENLGPLNVLRLTELRTDLQDGRNPQILAALDEFFQVFEDPASLKPNTLVPVQPSDIGQRIAALRSKLPRTPRDSRDMIEDEIRWLEQAIKASPDKPINIVIKPVAGDDHNPKLPAGNVRKNIAMDKYLQWKEAQGSGNNGTKSTQPQITDGHLKMKVARESERKGQTLGEIVRDVIPSKSKTHSPLESAISPILDSQVSTSQLSPPVGSDSAAISDLKKQVAELKDLIRGLIFQQMSTPGTYSGPQMLDSLKADLLAENSAPAAPVEDSATNTAMEPLVTSREPPQTSAHQVLSESPNVLEAPPKITYEAYPPDQNSQNTASKAPSQVVQYQPSQSLLAELFPEETKEVVAEERKEGSGSPARIPIPHVPLTPIDDSGAERRLSSGLGLIRRVRAKDPDLTVKSAVLELRYASKSLAEEDFRILIPRGLHMQEWTQRGEFVKVIPKRDPWTLEQNGNYYIVFNSEEDAKAYKQHVSHVHDLARQHTPTSLTSEIAPPPGYIINGEDVSGLVQSYALIPPQQKLFLQYLVPPFTPLQQNIFKRGGYAQILGEGRTSVAQVLVVFLEGRQPSYFEISDAVHLDGKRRGLQWKLLPGETAIRKVDMREPKKKEEESVLNRDFANEGEVDALSGLEAAEGGKRKRTVQDRAKTPTYGQRWILSFESVDEAKRFALQWHGRPFPWHDRAMKKVHRKGFGEQVLMVRAEYLW